jgi:hypothetical protein
MAGIWGQGEMALPGDPPGELEVVDGMPDGGKKLGIGRHAFGVRARLRRENV